MMRLRSYMEVHLPGAVHLWKRHKAQHLRGKSMEDVFTGIYHRNEWGDSKTRSGAASTLLNTGVVRAELPRLLENLGVRSLLDIPCGDFHWMKEVTLDLDCYIGADIVAELITSNEKFANDVRTFVKMDITCDTLPMVDLVLCRDCLIHFSFGDSFRAIKNIKASGSRYLLTTTFTRENGKNIDIVTGQWQTLNLQRPPFDFPPPVSLMREGFTPGDGRYADRCLALWRIADL